MEYIRQIRGFVPSCVQEEHDQKIILEWIHRDAHHILSRDNLAGHITSSGLIVNKNFTKLLMVHHNIYNTWTWTGGHADGEPNLLQVALKEAREETGIKKVEPYCDSILSIDILPVYGHFKNHQYVIAHLHLSVAYLLVADESCPLVINQSENSGVQWVALNEVREYSKEPFMIAIYKKMMQRLNMKTVHLL